MLKEELARYSNEVESYLTTSNGIGIVLLDQDFSILECNLGFMRLFNPRQNPTGEPLANYIELDDSDIRYGEELRLSCSRKSGMDGIIYCILIRTESGHLLLCERLILTESRALKQIVGMNDELINLQRELVKKNHLLEKLTGDLRKSEQFTTDILDSLPSNIAVLDSNGIIVAVNEPWRNFASENCCYDVIVDDLGKNFLNTYWNCIDGVENEGTEAAIKGVSSVLRGEQEKFAMEYPYHSPVEQRWFIMRVSSLKSSRRGAVVSLTNITKRKLAEIALEESNRKIEIMSNTDSLTRIANRRRFDEVLAMEYARHFRSRAELSLILLDIDHFKAFNDNYGHVKGDECLRQIAQVINDCTTRAADLAARYGGEEFACILPETDLNGAVAIAEKIRSAILACAISHKGSNVTGYVTVSLGVVAAQCTEDRSVVDIVAQADELLYRAKSLGRNRVEFYASGDLALTSAG